MQRKGQAAMEFLMTYGWAILAAIIAIGVLAYFGVFSPGKYAPTATILNPPFQAAAAVASASNGVTLEIKNGIGDTVQINRVSLTGADAGGCNDYATPVNVSAGSNKAVTLTGYSLTAGNTIKGDITIRYTKSGTITELSSTGTMTERVVA